MIVAYWLPGVQSRDATEGCLVQTAIGSREGSQDIERPRPQSPSHDRGTRRSLSSRSSPNEHAGAREPSPGTPFSLPRSAAAATLCAMMRA